MQHSYRTPYDDKPYKPPVNKQKRYATAAIVMGGALVSGSLLAGVNSSYQNGKNFGTPFSYAGKQYYLPGDSKRAVYPSREACMRDVPVSRQSECEPVNSYSSTAGARYGSNAWYGPVYNPRDTYQPGSQFPTETASGTNVGKKMPSGSSQHGFGSNGKAFTGSKGG